MVEVCCDVGFTHLSRKDVGGLLHGEYAAKLHHVLDEVLDGPVEDPPALSRERHRNRVKRRLSGSLGLARAYPLKNLKGLSTGNVSHWKAKKKFGYKTSYKNHNWPKRKQSLQLEGKEKY